MGDSAWHLSKNTRSALCCTKPKEGHSIRPSQPLKYQHKIVQFAQKSAAVFCLPIPLGSRCFPGKLSQFLQRLLNAQNINTVPSHQWTRRPFVGSTLAENFPSV